MPRPVVPCPDCGNDIGGTGWLDNNPDCPHGVITLADLSLAEVKALFADDCDGPGLNVEAVS